MKKRTKIIGHRGAKGLVEFENTIASFQKAIDIGCDGIEFDIRKTKDHKLIVHHDDHINNKIIIENNYDELQKIANAIGYQIPLFVDVIKKFKGQTFFDIELKEYGYEEEVIQVITQILDYHEFCVRSFHDRSIKRIKKLDKNIIAGLLIGTDKPRFGFISRIFELFPLFRVLNSRCDFVSPYYRLLILGYIKRMHILRKPVIAWTVNEEEVMRKLINKKIDGIVTDYPNITYQILNKK